MPQILYNAKNPQGALGPGFIEAAGPEDALAKLKAQGYTDIELHNAGAPGYHTAVAMMSEEQAREHAAFLLKLREKPGLGTVLAEQARRSKRWLIAYFVMMVAGVPLHKPLLSIFGLVLMILVVTSVIWKQRYARYFREMQRAGTVGDWDQALRMLARVRTNKHSPQTILELNFWEAQFKVRKGEPIAAALARLEALRPQFADRPGHFDARLSAVYSAAKDFTNFLAAKRTAFDTDPDNSMYRTDLALAEARVGDAAAAKTLLEGLNAEALIKIGGPFVSWTRGLIALREGASAAAQPDLVEGVSGFLKMTSPTSLVGAALCGGACALAMARNGQPDEAKKMIAQVWDLLLVHGDPGLMADVRREVGEPG